MNDPTNWKADDEVGSFAFASPEEATKAEAVMNRALKESFENGRKVGLEEAAKVCDEASDLHANGEEFMDACEFCASEIRERIDAASHRTSEEK